MLDVPESLLDERRRLGLDVFDEVWEGVLHMVPPPSEEHQRLGSELIAVLVGAAKRRGLVASYETGLFAAGDDYRVPDIVVSRPEDRSRRGVEDTGVLVIELRSPSDESDEKLPWYTARGVTEVLIVDTPSRQFELYRNTGSDAVTVHPDADGGVTLDSIGVRLVTVATEEGARLRVTTDAVTTDC
jgi:Uma2 family endonuclease